MRKLANNVYIDLLFLKIRHCKIVFDYMWALRKAVNVSFLWSEIKESVIKKKTGIF